MQRQALLPSVDKFKPSITEAVLQAVQLPCSSAALFLRRLLQH